MLVDELRQILIATFNRTFENLNTDFDNYRIKSGYGFFPHGNGLLKKEEEEIPSKCILVLGKDFGSTKYFEGVREFGEEKGPTLRNLLGTIEDSSKDKIFLSNVFMGLRKGDVSNIDNFSEQMNVQYLILCKEFLEITIAKIKPSLIVTLGSVPEQFLQQNIAIQKVKLFNIPHPSMWHFNLSKSSLTREEIRKRIVV